MTGHWKANVYWRGAQAMGKTYRVVGTGQFRATVEYSRMTPEAQAQHRGPLSQDVATEAEARALVEEVAK